MLRDWLLIATAIAVLWGLWFLLQFVFDSIDAYWDAWRRVQAETEGSAKRQIGARSSDSQ